MKKRLLIVQNDSDKDPGHLANILENGGVPYDIVNREIGEYLPPEEVEKYGAVVMLGGKESVTNHVSIPIRENQIAVRKAVAQKIPFFGICLGLQSVAYAAGEKISLYPADSFHREYGIGAEFAVTLTDSGKQHPLLEGVPETFVALQTHSEAVEPSGNIDVLGTSKRCNVQIAQIRPNGDHNSRIFGIQCHPEVTARMVKQWVTAMPEFRGREDQVIATFKEKEAEIQKICERIFSNFLRIAGLV